MPDAFILGFTKCATTSMYNQLLQHEDISRTKRKEPHYHFTQVMGDRFSGPADNDNVSQMFVTDPARYEALYEPGKLSIDGSAMSIADLRILEEINAQFPKAKHIIMLRDPTDRAFSAYSHLIRDARETRSFRDAIRHELSGARSGYMPIWRLLESSRYVRPVQHARKLLGNRLLVLAYRDYVANNHETMDELARFLGLVSIDWHLDHSNRSGVPKSKLFQKALMRESLAKTFFVKAFPNKFVTSLKRNLMECNKGAKPELTDRDRRFFLSCIADESDKIECASPDRMLLESLFRQ